MRARVVVWAAVVLIVAAATAGPSPASAQYKSAADIPAEVFAKLPSVSNLQLSPTGKYIAMLRPMQGRNALVIQPSVPSGSDGTISMPAPEPYNISWFQWMTDDLLLISIRFAAVRKLVPTVETRLITFNRATRKLAYIIRQEKLKRGKSRGSNLRKASNVVAQIQDDVIDYLWQDPDHILLSIDGDMDGKSEVRFLDVTNGNFRVIESEFKGIQNWYTDRQGTLRLASGIWETKYYINYRSPKSGEWSDFRKSTAYETGLRPIAFDDDPNHLFMSGRTENGTQALFRYDIARNEIIETLHNDAVYSYGGLLHEDWTGRVIGYYFYDDRMQQHYTAKPWQRRQRIIDKALPGTTNQFVSSTADHSRHIILAVSDVESGMYYVYDEAAKRIDPVTPMYPAFDPNLMSPVQPVTYEARDGLKIPAYLTIPVGKEAKKLPIVVLPHGGPRSRDTATFGYWPQFLASRGYAVLQPNFRGSTGYTADFQNAGINNWGLSMQDDITDGVNWLIGEGIADPERICIMGGSYGGYAALMGVVKTPDLYRCAISINGVTDLGRLIRSDRDYIGGKYWSRLIGDPGDDRAQLRETSPYKQIDRISSPILLIAAKDDRRVPYRQSETMAKALKKAKKKYKYVELESGDHGLVTEPARIAALQAVEAFLAKHLN